MVYYAFSDKSIPSHKIIIEDTAENLAVNTTPQNRLSELHKFQDKNLITKDENHEKHNQIRRPLSILNHKKTDQSHKSNQDKIDWTYGTDLEIVLVLFISFAFLCFRFFSSFNLLFFVSSLLCFLFRFHVCIQCKTN